MKVQCVLASSEISLDFCDLILFPEGVSCAEMQDATRRFPTAMVGGAVLQNGRSRGLLLKGSQALIKYWKVETDGRTIGSGHLEQVPIYETEDVCIGLMVCMDIENPTFRNTMVRAIRASLAKVKVLCIPADMGSYWFPGDHVDWLDGIHVVLCNHTKTHGATRCTSFIADTTGRKRSLQLGTETIFADLSAF